MGDGLEVTGGAGGSAARVEDMRTYAQIADRIGDHLDEAARQLGSLTVDPSVAVTTPLSPVTAARAQGQAVLATQQLARSMVGVRAQATRLRTTAQLIAAADAVDTFGQELRTSGTGFLALWSGLNATVWGTPPTYLRHAADGTSQAVQTGFEEGWEAFTEAMQQVPEAAREATTDALIDRWNHLLLDRPEVTNAVSDGLRATVSLLDGRLLSYPETLSSLIAAGERFGWLEDQPIQRTEASFEGVEPEVLASTLVPTSLEDLVRNQGSLMDLAKADETASRLRVIDVGTATDPAWVVQVPGTQALDGGTNPSDMRTNLYLSGPQEAALLDAVDDALRSHGVTATDPVMVVGHSQGGITAANFARQAEDRGFAVTHAFTIGAPVATIDIPEGVQLLAIEHTNDPIPRLDGRTNPDAPHVTTVVADVGGSDRFEAASRPHASELYRQTARQADESDDPSIAAWLDSADRYLSGPDLAGSAAVESGRVHDHSIQRGP